MCPLLRDGGWGIAERLRTFGRTGDLFDVLFEWVCNGKEKCMQFMTQRRPVEVNSSEEGLGNALPYEKRQKKMAWLVLSPLERINEPNYQVDTDVDKIRLQIGSYYYWVRMVQSIPELCRLAVRTDSLILYEVLQHSSLGISDDDLEDAVRQDDGELIVSRDYRISNHIKRKLQILYAP
jgi:hypothetical protein